MSSEGLSIGQSVFHNQTTVHPVGLGVLILLGIAMLFLPRRYSMVAVIACASFIAVGQRIVIASLDFNFLRLMVIFGWTRILLREEYRGFRLKKLDYCVVAWATAAAVFYSLSHGSSGIIYKLGMTFESLGMYFIARMLIRNLDDVRSLIDATAIISIPVACLFLIEHQTGRNLFSMFGGVPEITMIRQDKLRCQGAYAHPILAGCFWAAIIPLFVGRIASAGNGRYLSLAGLFASLTIVGMCASSTPVVGVLGGIAGFVLLFARRRMTVVQCLVVACLTCLHMVMEKPVWHLISRTDLIGGSTGWHRYHVINQFVNHFREWVLFGAVYIDHWDIFLNDITNQFVLEGVRGGGVTLACFIAMIIVAFRSVGALWRTVAVSRQEMFLAWAIGVSLFVHVVNFFGVSYFGQIDMLWYIGLALTAVVPGKVAASATRSRKFARTELNVPGRRTVPASRLVAGAVS